MARRSIALADLRPAPWNPRRALEPGDVEWAQLEASIREHGVADPLVVSHPSPWLASEGVEGGYLIVGGHQRARVLAHLGRDRLEVGAEVKLMRLASAEQEKRLCIALNSIAGDWDEERLAELMAEIRSAGDDDALGFTPSYVDELIARLRDEGSTALDADPWGGMPEFHQEDLAPWQRCIVNFRSEVDRERFFAIVGQSFTENTRSIWYPEAEIGRTVGKRFVAEGSSAPRYPIYVISKGRWERPLTARALAAMGVPFTMVVEEQERDRYAEAVDPASILVLPPSERARGEGSIPARNFVWQHAAAAGAPRHWILDDNINNFYRLHRNFKIKVSCGATFRAAEEFVDRYENVGLAGFNYFMFASRKTTMPPFYLNTRIYSCILVDCALPFRWRGRYNEDTDLSLRVLKYGLCTVLFNAFLAEKMTTMTMKGGNTDEIYGDDGRLKMAESLKQQHPDVVRIVKRWGRWQHWVNYAPFRKNRLKLRPGAVIPEGIEEFGMELERLDERDLAAEAVRS